MSTGKEAWCIVMAVGRFPRSLAMQSSPRLLPMNTASPEWIPPMIIALAAILTVWVAAAIVLAFADGKPSTGAAVATALASTETIRRHEGAWGETDGVRADWATDGVAAA